MVKRWCSEALERYSLWGERVAGWVFCHSMKGLGSVGQRSLQLIIAPWGGRGCMFVWRGGVRLFTYDVGGFSSCPRACGRQICGVESVCLHIRWAGR